MERLRDGEVSLQVLEMWQVVIMIGSFTILVLTFCINYGIIPLLLGASWCLLVVLIRQGLLVGGGPQRSSLYSFVFVDCINSSRA